MLWSDLVAVLCPVGPELVRRSGIRTLPLHGAVTSGLATILPELAIETSNGHPASCEEGIETDCTGYG